MWVPAAQKKTPMNDVLLFQCGCQGNAVARSAEKNTDDVLLFQYERNFHKPPLHLVQ